MGRVINTDSTGKQRNQLMRTAAELLRHLSQQQDIDNNAKDMLAAMVFCFRGIDEGIEQSAQAWEKRDYWMKADELRQRWFWAGGMADDLKALLVAEEWDRLPTVLAKLLPHFTEFKITKFTRSEEVWAGSYTRLLREQAK
ncbi:MAG: hypothetical protein KC547_15415 [Anaerolineae bacterium]|nr:hypothetical protein [Anaerolineae bacterium]